MASTIKVDNVQNTPGTNIINKCSTTITIGASSDTIALACGASQTGFGRTGTVDWQTGDIKTAAFIPATGKGYFVNTTAGAITVNLPAGSAGDIVGLKDYANTWDSYAVTLNPNGVDKIGGGSTLDPTLTSEGGAVLLVYVDGTQGWLTTAESVTASPSGLELFVTATVSGACNTLTTAPCCSDAKIAKFVGPGTFCVSTAATCSTNNLVSYMVVAGAGGGGGNHGGGGGAGGFREAKSPVTPYTASPLDGYPNAPNRITVTATAYPIAVGGGGAGGAGPGTQGSAGVASSFSSITSAGGGEGGTEGVETGQSGGSGGGSTYTPLGIGTGNTPPTSPAQGTNGGNGVPGSPYAGGGGGGATVVGTTGVPATTGPGGTGATTSIDGTPTARAGGGGAGRNSYGASAGGCGGAGGGGAGGTPGVAGVAGTVNTGGGGGGGFSIPNTPGAAGGSGIVMIRYKFQ